MGKASRKRKELFLSRELDVTRQKVGFGKRIVKFNHVAKGVVEHTYYNRFFDLISEKEALGDPVVIFCNQVAKYYYDAWVKLYETELQYSDSPPNYEETYWRERLAKIAPPFDKIFFEFRTDDWIKSRITGWPSVGGGLIEVADGDEATEWRWLLKITTYEYEQLGDTIANIFGAEDPEDDIWKLRAGVDNPFEPEKSHSSMGVYLDNDGEIIAIDNENGHPGYETEYFEDICRIGLLTLMFINCRNIRLADEEVPIITRKTGTGQSQKKVYYKVLKLSNSYSERSDDNAVNGTKLLPLHVVRGHFASYTDDAPLFGKYTGTFWKPAHTRGSAEQGVVVKDYDVQAPVAE